jgi:exodeoxyribonuclease VII large subunit
VDFTIADFVADVRASTPSNAAELVVERADTFCDRIDRAQRRLRSVMQLSLARREQRVQRVESRLHHWPAVLVMRGRDVSDLRHRLDRGIRAVRAAGEQRHAQLRRRLEARDLRRVAASLRTRLATATGRLTVAVTTDRLERSARLGALSAQLDALSPLAVLGRGYSVCWNAARDRIIRSSQRVLVGEMVRVSLAEGELGCRVETTDGDAASEGVRSATGPTS